MANDGMDGELRVLSLLTPREDLTAAQFTGYWREVHAPLVTELPHLLAYRQYEVVGELARPARTNTGPPVLGVAELVFDSLQGRVDAYASAAGARLTADGANFVSGGRSLHVVRHTILDRAR